MTDEDLLSTYVERGGIGVAVALATLAGYQLATRRRELEAMELEDTRLPEQQELARMKREDLRRLQRLPWPPGHPNLWRCWT